MQKEEKQDTREQALNFQNLQATFYKNKPKDLATLWTGPKKCTPYILDIKIKILRKLGNSNSPDVKPHLPHMLWALAANSKNVITFARSASFHLIFYLFM